MLYPLKFKPIFKERIWGGNKLKSYLNKIVDANLNIGESWEISAINGELSVVENGEYAGMNIVELISEFKAQLLGKKVYEKHGLEFPILAKFIDANDKLSVQVHPNDSTAKLRHNSSGKTEMWYVLDAMEDAELILGFNSKTTTEIVNKSIAEVTLENLLKKERVKKGDVFFIPAGCVHSIGKGILIAEIQQSSDITYRLYDYNRKDEYGNSRELHVHLAEDVMNLEGNDSCKVEYVTDRTGIINVVKCKYFTTNIIKLDNDFYRNNFSIDSFVIYMCVYGEFDIKYGNNEYVNVAIGETVLIPCCLTEIELIARVPSKILEIYID